MIENAKPFVQKGGDCCSFVNFHYPIDSSLSVVYDTDMGLCRRPEDIKIFSKIAYKYSVISWIFTSGAVFFCCFCPCGVILHAVCQKPVSKEKKNDDIKTVKRVELITSSRVVPPAKVVGDHCDTKNGNGGDANNANESTAFLSSGENMA